VNKLTPKIYALPTVYTRRKNSARDVNQSRFNVKKDISRELQRDQGSISREIKFNGHPCGRYFAHYAHKICKQRRHNANQLHRKITRNSWLEKYIKEKLKLRWSPEQIAGRLERKNGQKIIHHETIYQWIYNIQPEYKQYLRCIKGKYRRRYGTKIREKQREEAKKRRIDTRPKHIETRERIGDWEGDTVLGKEKTKRILTLVDRKSGYLIADKLESATAEHIRNIAIKNFRTLPKYKRHSLTLDNGVEFSDYETLEARIGIAVYFAYPYHSWERGSNENTNGLLRQFFPKKSAFANISSRQIKKVVRLINDRPRKRLGFLSPHELFNDCTLN